MNPFKAAHRYWRFRASWLGDGGQPVEQVQAQQRAEVCAVCEQNQPHGLWETLTAPAVAEITGQLAIKDELNLKVDGEDRLHICERCWCYLPLKVYGPLKHILVSTNSADMPDNCWIKQEVKEQK